MSTFWLASVDTVTWLATLGPTPWETPFPYRCRRPLSPRPPLHGTTTARTNANQPIISCKISHPHSTEIQPNHGVELSCSITEINCHLSWVPRELFETITTNLFEEITIPRTSLLKLKEQIQCRDAVFHTPALRPGTASGTTDSNPLPGPLVVPKLSTTPLLATGYPISPTQSQNNHPTKRILDDQCTQR